MKLTDQYGYTLETVFVDDGTVTFTSISLTTEAVTVDLNATQVAQLAGYLQGILERVVIDS